MWKMEQAHLQLLRRAGTHHGLVQTHLEDRSYQMQCAQGFSKQGELFSSVKSCAEAQTQKPWSC